MEFSRKEYPAIVEALQPGQAVAVLNDRIRHVGKLNGEIADWLQERRRIEELYVQGLRRLASKKPPDDNSELGIFQLPWQKIIASAEAIAESHHTLAQKIESDVERPLREFVATNREMLAMSNMQGNLQSMAKDIETAQKKVDKLKERGAKAAASKVASATQEVENATSTWDSQAPFVFEKLQAVDESRVNHLRDVLTQFQTHEVDQVERSRVSAEETLNALLNVETADEITTWAVRTQTEKPRQKSRSSGPPISLTPTAPANSTDDGASQRSSSIPEQKPDRLHGLKRLGTVLGRRRQSAHPYGRSLSPERKSSSNLGSAFSGFRGKSREAASPAKLKESFTPSPKKPQTPTRSTPQPSEASTSNVRDQGPSSTEMFSNSIPEVTAEEEQDQEKEKEKAPESKPGTSSGPVTGEEGLTNGFKALDTAPQLPQISQLQEPLQPTLLSPIIQEPPKDSEGFSVPPSALDAITQAQQEANAVSETPTPQFKVDIRNAPIQEEDGDDAQTALANVANTLRAQAVPTRRSGTLRGRRDVRNTIFVPATASPTDVLGGGPTGASIAGTLGNGGSGSQLSIPEDQSAPDGNTLGTSSLSANTAATFRPTTPIQSAPTTAIQSSPFKLPQRGNFLNDDHAASDTQSIRSGRSLASSTSTTIKHPDMHESGLNSSVIEVVSTWFKDDQISKALVIGQIALAFNPVDLSSPFGTETIRLENFQALEKVAPNPAFIEQIPDQAGNYTVDLSKITKTSVGFHYQVHLDTENMVSYSPLQFEPAWKPEPTQTSVILNYSLNPAFVLAPGATSVKLTNLVLIVHLEPGVKTTHCQSMPVGTYSREKNLIYWKLGDVTLSAADASDYKPPSPLRARFYTESEAKPGHIEARWEISGDAMTAGLGSGLAVSQLVQTSQQSSSSDGTAAAATEEKSSDPFADEDTEADSPAVAEDTVKPEPTWKDVPSIRKIMSGTYQIN